MDATPRPWKLIGKTVRGANGEFVGLLMDVSTQSPTDADFAIRAVNSHSRLIEALEAMVREIDAHDAAAGISTSALVGAYFRREQVATARAALAAARGEVE